MSPAALTPRWLSRRCLMVAASFAVSSLSAQDAEKFTYDDHIRPMLENKCFSCHNPDKKKGGLDLTSYAAMLNGGGGGAAVDPGNPLGSRLLRCSSKKEEPFMPPEGAPLEAKDLEILSKWIAGGILQAKGSVARKSNRPKVDLTFSGAPGKPSGPAARPHDVLLEPVIVTPRTTAVVAMAASPWTSLLAVAGQHQILLYDTDSKELAGILPYTEGYARSLKFSANGSLLVMGGGRGGKIGHAIVWDVATGRRVVEVGKEFDQVMSADITPDHRKVTIGTNSKKVKCYDVATGELVYTIAKHTEWVTGVRFSPDGVLLATSDRNGNVMAWEADSGGEFYNLGQHTASVTDLAWRADSNVLASCSVDGTISLWEMKTGKRIANWSAHGSVQSVSFTPDGRLVSCGKDGTMAVWSIDGKSLAKSTSQGDVVSKVVALSDGKSCVTGNWLGEVKFYDISTGKDVSQVSSNPPKIADRILEAEARLKELEPELPKVQAAVVTAEKAIPAAEAEVARLRPMGEPAAKALASFTTKLEQIAKSRDYWVGQVKLAKTPEAKTKATTAVAASAKSTAAVKAEAEKVRPTAEPFLTAEAALAKLRNDLTIAQAAVRNNTAETAARRERIVFLKAAQFNVGVLSEREKLTKLETDIADFIAAKAENEAAKVAAAGRIEPALKAAEEAAKKIAAQESALAALKEEFTALDRALNPLRQAEAEAAGRSEVQAKAVASSNDVIVGLGRDRDVGLAAAKAALADYTKSRRPTRAIFTEATTRAAELTKQGTSLKGEMLAQQQAVAAALAVAEAAVQEVAARGNALKDADAAIIAAQAALVTAQQQFEAARGFKAIFSTSYFSLRKQTAAALLSAQDAMVFARNIRETSAIYLADADKSLGVAKLGQAAAIAARTALQVKQEMTEKSRLTALAERDAITAERTATQKETARLQAVSAEVEKAYQGKLPAAQAELTKQQAVLVPLEKALADVRAKLAEASKPAAEKSLAVDTATKQLEAFRQEKLTAEKTAVAARKEIPQREKSVEEITHTLAELTPQVEPLKAKVQQVQAAYLAMLPRKN